MKKTILLALVLMLLLVGCSQSIGIGDTRTPAAPDTTREDTPLETPAAAQTPAGGQPSDQVVPGSALTEDDLSIVVEGVTIAIGADPAPVIDAFGEDGMYADFYIYVEEGTSEISEIGLNTVATIRGVKPGDSYEDMLAQYGEPDEENSGEGMKWSVYQSGERMITFVLENEIISSIKIQ